LLKVFGQRGGEPRGLRRHPQITQRWGSGAFLPLAFRRREFAGCGHQFV